MKELSKEDQKRIEKEMLSYGTSANYAIWRDGFKEGAEYEHPIAYNKGLEAAAGYFNNQSFKEGYNQAIEEIRNLVKNRTISNVGGEIGLSVTFLKDLEKLKK